MCDLSYLEPKYKNEYKIEHIEEKLDKLLKSYDTSIDKILCIFEYKRNNRLELSILTSPKKDIPLVIIDKK